MQRLDPRVRIVWGLMAVLASLIVAVVSVTAIAFLTDWNQWLGLLPGSIVLVIGVVFALLRYRRWSFEVQEDALYLERGVVTHVRTVVPFVRIQHVDTQRGPVERLFGIGSVVVFTAGSRGADVSIPGLSPDRATELQGRLRSLVGASESEDAV